MVEILSLFGRIAKRVDKKADEQPDTTDMTDLESEESAAQRKKAIRTRAKNNNTRSNAQ